MAIFEKPETVTVDLDARQAQRKLVALGKQIDGVNAAITRLEKRANAVLARLVKRARRAG